MGEPITGRFKGVSLGEPCRVTWQLKDGGHWVVSESGKGWAETTMGVGRDSLDRYLATLRP